MLMFFCMILIVILSNLSTPIHFEISYMFNGIRIAHRWHHAHMAAATTCSTACATGWPMKINEPDSIEHCVGAGEACGRIAELCAPWAVSLAPAAGSGAHYVAANTGHHASAHWRCSLPWPIEPFNRRICKSTTPVPILSAVSGGQWLRSRPAAALPAARP